VFFHRRLRCLVIIDLKVGRFSYADAGQMHLYLNYAREHWMKPGENPPVGLILCAEKGAAEPHYALDNLPNKILAAEYQTVLPDEAMIVQELALWFAAQLLDGSAIQRLVGEDAGLEWISKSEDRKDGHLGRCSRMGGTSLPKMTVQKLA